MPANFRIVAEMTLWERAVTFSFAAMPGGGYAGELTFPDKVSITDIMRKIWQETAGEANFPLGDLELGIESVKAFMKKAKDGNSSLIMFEIVVEGIQLGVYFIKDEKNNTETTVFNIKTRDSIIIDSLPGVDTQLPNPIRTNLSLTLSTGPTQFILGEKTYTYEKGFGFDCHISIPEVLNRHFIFVYNPDKRRQDSQNPPANNGTPQSPANQSTDTSPSADSTDDTNTAVGSQLSSEDSRLTFRLICPSISLS